MNHISPGLTGRPLDEWYRKLNGIYLDRNFYRDAFSIFSHLVEVMGGLSLMASEKTKPNTSPELYIPKALAWWLALCGKLGVRSVEDMVWNKFPGVCSYCERQPHRDDVCRQRKRSAQGPDWAALEKRASQTPRPRSLAEWQNAFYDIYPSTQTEPYSLTFARFTEELGELAEAIRVSPIAPGYILSEAADVFAWLMHLQNLIEDKSDVDPTERGAALASAFATAYPDVCRDCGNPVCTCPPILPGTLGRIAHEVPLNSQSFSHGGALLAIDEAMELFRLGERTIQIGDTKIEVSSTTIREIHQMVTQLTTLALDGKEEMGHQAANLIEISRRITSLTETQRVTQEGIEELADAVARLPPDARERFLADVRSLSTSVWAGAFIELVTSLAS